MSTAGLRSQLRVKIWGIIWGGFLLPWSTVRGRRFSHVLNSRVKIPFRLRGVKKVRSTEYMSKAPPGVFFFTSLPCPQPATSFCEWRISYPYSTSQTGNRVPTQSAWSANQQEINKTLFWWPSKITLFHFALALIDSFHPLPGY